MEIKIDDVVLIRLDCDYGKSNTWWKVISIDDKYLYGTIFRNEPFVDIHKGKIEKFEIKEVQRILQENDSFCYSDNVTICNCPGLCRNK